MAEHLRGRRVAALVAKGFEQVELFEPREALKAAGAIVHVVSPETFTVRGWNHTEWGDEIAVDRSSDDARADDYDALLLPGGVTNRGIVSSRRPADLPAFINKMLAEFAKRRYSVAATRRPTHVPA